MIKTSILILEENGDIDSEERDFIDRHALTNFAVKFVRLFIGDPFHRVVRIIERPSNRVLLNFDSETGAFTVQI